MAPERGPILNLPVTHRVSRIYARQASYRRLSGNLHPRIDHATRVMLSEAMLSALKRSPDIGTTLVDHRHGRRFEGERCSLLDLQEE